MDLENIVLSLGKEIYQIVTDFVEENKGNDDKLYRSAILKLKDGRVMRVPFNAHEQGEVSLSIDNHEWNSDLGKTVGEYFCIDTPTPHGMFVDGAVFFDYDRVDVRFSFSESPYYPIMPMTSDVEFVKKFVLQIRDGVSKLEYDKEATCSIDNLNYEEKKKYNIDRFNFEVAVAKENGYDVIPSVETAVDIWCDMLFNIEKTCDSYDLNSQIINKLSNCRFASYEIKEEQIAKFKHVLKDGIMKLLSNGREAKLEFDYFPVGMLSVALDESGITNYKIPFKTVMDVGVDSVQLGVMGNDGYEYKEVFICDNQDEVIKRR